MLGVRHYDEYAVNETFQLFKIQWEWYNETKTYDVVITEKNDFNENNTNIIDISQKDIFKEISFLLNKGIDNNRIPLCEMCIDELRDKLKNNSILIEIPPSPWNHTYMIALTHDVDKMSVREIDWIDTIYLAFLCFKKANFFYGLIYVFARLGYGEDPWFSIPKWKTIEKNLGVNSTFYFIPFDNRPGIGSPTKRGTKYKLNREIINNLVNEGWEVGVHGIDNWIDPIKGKDEKEQLNLNGNIPIGTRVHWLLFDEKSFKNLDYAGYYYDSSIGYNHDVGFKSGTLQIYRPRDVEQLAELPLHIQDTALFGEYVKINVPNSGWTDINCLNLDGKEAENVCSQIIQHANRYGGVVTLLWHQHRLSPPRNWDSLYRILIEKGLNDNAWISKAVDIVDWFILRRNIQLEHFQENKTILIKLKNLMIKSNIPNMKVRVHIIPERISHIDGEYIKGVDYIDIKADRSEFKVILK
jgi:hypothetical protein